MGTAEPLTHFSRAYGAPPARGRIRVHPEDFCVDEVLGFAPAGHGEHVLLRVRKRGANTEWVARRLAERAGVRTMDVGYAGRKDRAAVATQWFSVHLPGARSPDWAVPPIDSVQVLEVRRHDRKLRRGVLRGNRFEIRVRGLDADRSGLEARLQQAAARGVPNYFGEQRFGHDGQNLDGARRMLVEGVRPRARSLRGLYLSAARSLLFNRVLALRVDRDLWDRAIGGDVLMLDGTRSIFGIAQVDAEIRRRVEGMDVHPTGPLWGRGPSPVRGEALRLEQAALEDRGDWRRGLERAGPKQERRSLRLKISELDWEWAGRDGLRLRFYLPRGGYATSVLRELVDYGQ
ncbi:MAG: tRNA pseudouridine(13) synthase TruD [Gammaproteobacteria bacterium]|nr:tRNA pseudouridine(13) synthase TruD [Gammaproteobacteria bacterium]NIR27837.1 tRNA pseudouridine(13) synthase TruD [Gammaproteobacteria bacterium]NIR96534.1 tRNA pseudouridine(13) synthase TruD [Gammaproteobacteria bacterium]NIT62272.1 tRNA pseudouridine(13) synthase TruD [Gammaproteobacteria bacterium]NIV19123.1 tRNA pseudouridine(13) synthase TruD [Gammaproteobacteria bacterium]